MIDFEGHFGSMISLLEHRLLSDIKLNQNPDTQSRGSNTTRNMMR